MTRRERSRKWRGRIGAMASVPCCVECNGRERKKTHADFFGRVPEILDESGETIIPPDRHALCNAAAIGAFMTTI